MNVKIPIMFTSNSCGACKEQLDIIHKNFADKKEKVSVMKVDVDKHNVPFIKYTPTWFIPNSKGSYDVIENVITTNLDRLVVKNKKIPQGFGSKRKTLKKPLKKHSTRSSRFGYKMPEINTLAKDGKNFPNNKSFNIPNSFMNDIQDKWGNDYLTAGSLGRDQGPGNFNNVLTNNYVNDIRMVQPNGPHGAALELNRKCNQSPSMLEYPGMVYDSKNPQIVNTTSFGKKENKRKHLFGCEQKLNYGPAYKPQYIMEKDTVKKLYGGALSDNLPRPQGIKNDTYIGQAQTYNPLEFGKKIIKGCKTKIKCKSLKKKNAETRCQIKKICKSSKYIGEGTVLTLKGNKVKIKN